MAGNLGDINVNVTADTSDFSAGMKKIQDEASTASSSISSKLKDIGSAMSSMGTKLTAGVTLPVVAGFAASVKAAADFDTALSKIRSVTGMTADQITAMGDAAKSMSDGSTFSATQVADAMYWLADSTSTAEDIQGYLAGAMDLASASGSDLSETAQVLQGLMKAYNIDASESGKVTDILTVAFQNSLWTGEEFNTAMGYVAATASQMNIPLEQTAAALDVMSRAGYDASTAGAGLRAGLVSLVNPTKEAVNTLKKYGLSASDVNPQVVGLDQALQSLHDANISASDAANIFTTESMGQMLSIIASSDDDFQTLIGNMGDSAGAAQTAADVMANSASGKFKIFKDKLLDIGISVGEKLLPPLTRLLDDVIVPLFDAFSNMPSGFQDMALALAGIAAAAGPAMMALGPLISGAGSLMGAVGGGGGLLGMLGGGGAAAGAAGGIGLAGAAAVAAPVAAVAGVGAWAAMRDFDTDAMAQDLGNLGKTIGDFAGGISNTVNGIDWTGITNKVLNFFPDAIGKVGDWLSTINLQDAWDGLSSASDDFYQGLKDWFSSIDWEKSFGDMGDSASKLINGLIDAFGTIDWGKAFGDVGSKLATILTDAATFLANIDFSKLGANIAEWLGSIDWMKLLGDIGNFIAGIAQGISDFLTKTDWVAVFSAIANLALGIPMALAGALGSIDWVKLATDLGTWALDVLGKIVSALTDAVVDFASVVVKWVGDFVNSLINGAGQLVDTAAQWLSDFLGGLVDTAMSIPGKAWDLISSFINSLVDTATSIPGKAYDLVKSFIDGLADTAGKIVGKAGELVSSFIDSLVDTATSIPGKAGDLVTSFINGLTDTIGDIYQKGKDAVNKFIDGIKSGIEGIGSGLGDLIGLHAEGGYFTKPHIGVVAERGPEWILNLGQMRDLVNGVWGQAYNSALAAGAYIGPDVGPLSGGLSDIVPSGMANSVTSRSTRIGEIHLHMGTPSSPRAFAKDLAKELKLMGLA